MTDSRLFAAAEHSHLVVDAAGLLAVFNDAGVLNPLDVQAAAAVGRLLDEPDERVLLAAALTVRGTRFGHVCIRLDTVREAVVVDGQDPEQIETLPWPDLDEWQAALANSPLVGDGTTDTPLVLEDGRLYLERYHRYEQQVAQLITQRIDTEIVPPVGGKHRRPEAGGRGEAHLEELAAEIVPPLGGKYRQAEPGGRGETHHDESDAEIVPPVGGKYRRPEAGGRGETEPGGRGAALLTQLLDENSRQHQAAVLALTSRFSVIAGGPGTGKTHTIAALLAALAAGDEFPKVALCAPTGKAAARLGEAVSDMAASLGDERISTALATVEPSTMHRLLGWTWGRGRFAYNAAHRLPHDLVIVDEMSMVSLPMAAKLLKAVRDDATVVLVGDPYQLESIEAGTVLADIVGAAEEANTPIADHVVVLDRVHRFEEDSAIADFAEAVRHGDADTAVELLQTGGDALSWVEDRSASGFGELWEAVLEQRTRMVKLAQQDPQQALDALTEMAVLCARRTGRDGVSVWGRDIETALDERFTGLRWGSEWYPGRPVMVTSNDYRLDLYNGDIGICVKTGEAPLVVFERNGLRLVPPSHLGDHSTVHAMTIHKSQGSQFNEVVVVLPGESSRMLTRELLYTAVTRASSRVRIVGSEDVVRRAIERSVQRASGLGGRLGS